MKINIDEKIMHYELKFSCNDGCGKHDAYSRLLNDLVTTQLQWKKEAEYWKKEYKALQTIVRKVQNTKQGKNEKLTSLQAKMMIMMEAELSKHLNEMKVLNDEIKSTALFNCSTIKRITNSIKKCNEEMNMFKEKRDELKLKLLAALAVSVDPVRIF